MDLIVTDAGHIDRAVIEDYALDAAWGADENDFELTVDRMLEPGSYVYADGSELGGVIDSLRDRTQLIMITHQRRTMETADVLFGVSMQADGVTKVISQKLDQALKHAE